MNSTMARDKKDAWSRFREREDQRDDELKKEVDKALGHDANESSNKIVDGQKAAREAPQKPNENPVIRMIARADMMLEQVQHLFNMYVAGIEMTPPHTQRKQLQDLYQKVVTAPKNSTNILFRANQFVTKYNMYHDRWERLMKDIETGKVIVRKADQKKPKF